MLAAWSQESSVTAFPCFPRRQAAARCARPQDDADHQRELYATILNALLMNFLDSAAGR